MTKPELQIIKELEKSLNIQIPEVANIDWYILGYTYSQNKINKLGLCNCKIQTKDLSLIEELVNLELLDLSQNQITEIQSLNKLVNLQKLSLDSNQIEDTSPLEILYLNQKQAGKPILKVEI